MKYLWLTLKHKWFVFLAGFKTGASWWRLLTHDWTKFLSCELPHYQKQFFGPADDPGGFIRCWVHHQNHNDHHWEYWIPRTGHNRCTPAFPDGEPIPMPMPAVQEMVADWLGASRAYERRWPTRESWPWFEEHWDQIRRRLHCQTIHHVIGVMEAAGFGPVITATRKTPKPCAISKH